MSVARDTVSKEIGKVTFREISESDNLVPSPPLQSQIDVIQ